MASLTRLLRGGSLVPDGAGGFKFKLDTKFKWETAKLKRKIGEANARALKKVGGDVRTATKKAMSWRTPKKPREWKIATRGGTSTTSAARRDSKGRFLKGSGKKSADGSLQLVALIDKVPKPGVITSWRTARFPRGFLREDIEYDYSYRTQSVAIGPWKSPRVNRLLEFGGTTTHYFMPVRRQPRGRKQNVVYGRLQNSRPRIKGTRILQSGFYSFRRTIKGRGFMAKGLAKAMPKIPDRFKNSIQGP